MGSLRLLLAFLTTILTLNPVTFSARPAQTPSNAEVAAILNETNGWSDGSTDFTQYEVTVQNKGDGTVSDWTLTLDASTGLTVSQFWNCTLTQNGTRLLLVPADYARFIPSNGQTQGIGLIVSGGKLAVKDVTATLQNGAAPTVSEEGRATPPFALIFNSSL